MMNKQLLSAGALLLSLALPAAMNAAPLREVSHQRIAALSQKYERDYAAQQTRVYAIKAFLGGAGAVAVGKFAWDFWSAAPSAPASAPVEGSVEWRALQSLFMKEKVESLIRKNRREQSVLIQCRDLIQQGVVLGLVAGVVGALTQTQTSFLRKLGTKISSYLTVRTDWYTDHLQKLHASFETLATFVDGYDDAALSAQDKAFYQAQMSRSYQTLLRHTESFVASLLASPGDAAFRAWLKEPNNGLYVALGQLHAASTAFDAAALEQALGKFELSVTQVVHIYQTKTSCVASDLSV